MPRSQNAMIGIAVAVAIASVLTVAALLSGCETGREYKITVHRVGGGCVAIFADGDGNAMAAIPCPAATLAPAESEDGGAR